MNVKIKALKDHTGLVSLKKGEVRNVREGIATLLVEKKVAEEVKETYGDAKNS